jgi:hypothetical protein
MPDLENYMLRLAEATNSDVHNQVFVYRKVLTDVYRLGHDDGMRAAKRDDFVRQQIEDAAATDAAHTRKDTGDA